MHRHPHRLQLGVKRDYRDIAAVGVFSFPYIFSFCILQNMIKLSICQLIKIVYADFPLGSTLPSVNK